jgi:hypothetical protein
MRKPLFPCLPLRPPRRLIGGGRNLRYSRLKGADRAVSWSKKYRKIIRKIIQHSGEKLAKISEAVFRDFSSSSWFSMVFDYDCDNTYQVREDFISATNNNFSVSVFIAVLSVFARKTGFASCVKNVFLAFFPNKNVLFRGYIDLLSHTFFFGFSIPALRVFGQRPKPNANYPTTH